MKLGLLVFLSVVSTLLTFGTANQPAEYSKFKREAVNPDAHLTTPELLKKYGYPVQSINITTEDGYILTIHRIPHGKNNSAGGPAVILDHGLISTSANWVLSGPGKGFAYILADQGYDVWLMNARGNTYSRAHKTLSPKDQAFWEFSFHEMGLYDVPAVIDTALNTTGQTKVQYTGYDLTGSKILVLFSQRPEYNNKVKLVSIMAPSVYGNNMRSPARVFSGLSDNILFDALGHGELLLPPLADLINLLLPTVCTPQMLNAKVCQAPVYLIAGFDPKQTNFSLVPVILGHQTSTSTRTLIHFLQSIKNRTFRQYNFGLLGNMKHYNQSSPPDYIIKNAVVPFALYWGENDLLADKKDILRLNNELPNVVKYFRVDFKEWNHVDMVEAIDAPKLVYPTVLKTMALYP